MKPLAISKFYKCELSKLTLADLWAIFNIFIQEFDLTQRTSEGTATPAVKFSIVTWEYGINNSHRSHQHPPSPHTHPCIHIRMPPPLSLSHTHTHTYTPHTFFVSIFLVFVGWLVDCLFYAASTWGRTSTTRTEYRGLSGVSKEEYILLLKKNPLRIPRVVIRLWQLLPVLRAADCVCFYKI